MRFYLRALSYFRDDLPLIVMSLVLIALSTLSAVIQPLVWIVLLDLFLVTNHYYKTTPTYWAFRGFAWISRQLHIVGDLGHQVIAIAVFALLLRVLQELLSMANRLISAYIGYHGLLRVRCDLFRKLQELSIGYHRSQPQGDAIYRLSYDSGGFQTILQVLVNNIVVGVSTLMFMTIVMLQMDWKLTLITLSVAPVLLLLTKLFADPLKRRWIEAKETESELTTLIQRSASSIGLVQAFRREDDEFARFHATARSTVHANLRQNWQDGWYWLLVGAIFGLGYAIILGYGGLKAFHNMHSGVGLTITQLGAFLYYVNQVYGPLQTVTGSGASIQSGVAGVQRVFEVLDRDAIIKDAPNAIALPRKSRTLSLNDVGFEYREGEPVLRNVTATISPGKMVAFVGSSGVGKTTLLNLLPRFYDPTTGAMTLDNIDVRKIRVHDVRAHVALVLQENIVLPTTVAENIAYGRPLATAAQIHEAARLAGAAAFIDKLPDKYDTLVNEGGSNLSGGQRQRIGIARALLTEAPFMVFDEPTSALDPQNEAQITKTLRDLKGQRTILLVSHRLSTVIDCDEIFVMDEGRIVERGTHKQLVQQHGLYFSMAKSQLGIQDPADAVPTSDSDTTNSASSPASA